MNYFCVLVHLYNRKTALRGIREYATEDYQTVYRIVLKELQKYYLKSDIMKIDVWPIANNAPEVLAYLEKKKVEENG